MHQLNVYTHKHVKNICVCAHFNDSENEKWHN